MGAVIDPLSLPYRIRSPRRNVPPASETALPTVPHQLPRENQGSSQRYRSTQLARPAASPSKPPVEVLRAQHRARPNSQWALTPKPTLLRALYFHLKTFFVSFLARDIFPYSRQHVLSEFYCLRLYQVLGRMKSCTIHQEDIPMGFEEISHTADWSVRVWAEDL